MKQRNSAAGFKTISTFTEMQDECGSIAEETIGEGWWREWIRRRKKLASGKKRRKRASGSLQLNEASEALESEPSSSQQLRIWILIWNVYTPAQCSRHPRSSPRWRRVSNGRKLALWDGVTPRCVHPLRSQFDCGSRKYVRRVACQNCDGANQDSRIFAHGLVR